VAGGESFWAQYGTVLLLGLGLLTLGELVWLTWMHLRLKRALAAYQSLLIGAEGASLESLLHAYAAQVKETTSQVQYLTTAEVRLENDLRRSLQRVGVVRYNPFANVGGDQSFAIALTDALGNGFVISSLHHRDRTQVYGKPVIDWTSPYALSDEESSAIEIARQGQPPAGSE